jgi:hypothetical protein
MELSANRKGNTMTTTKAQKQSEAINQISCNLTVLGYDPETIRRYEAEVRELLFSTPMSASLIGPGVREDQGMHRSS